MDDKKVKKSGKKGKMPSAPIKAPGGNVKGIGPKGQFTGGLSPTVVDPKYGGNPGTAKLVIKGMSSTKSPKK